MNDIERTRSALFFLNPAVERLEWFKIACAVKDAVGDEVGFTLFDEWSRLDPDGYDPRDVRTMWGSVNGIGGVKQGTLFYKAKAIGWRDHGRPQRTPEEIADWRRKSAERAAREEARRARQHAAAAQLAVRVLKATAPASGDHPYLIRKQIAPVESLREVSEAESILGYSPKCRDAPLVGRLLVAPVEIDGKLSTLEFIDEAGRKSVIAGGRKTDGLWTAQPLPDGDDAAKPTTLVIAEGVATALSAGYPAVSAMTSSNLKSVALQMRERYPAVDLVVLADLLKATGEPDPHAVDAARAVGGRVAIPDFGEGRDPSWTDLNDLLVHRGSDAVAACIASAKVPEAEAEGTKSNGSTAPPGGAASEEWRDAVARLAALPAIEYDRVRQAEADALGARVGTLDSEVEKLRRETAGSEADGQGEAVLFPELEPWHESVDGAKLLTDLAATFKRFAVLPKLAEVALALWTVFTHAIGYVNIAPILGITAPQHRCGKSTVLAMLMRVVLRPMPAANISPAAVFRSVERWSPSLLIDEADSFLRDNEEMRGIINSGHVRDLAFVVRVCGDDHEPRRFTTWCPKSIALIGKLPNTIADRSIEIPLKRKLRGESVDKLRHAEPGEFLDLARRCARFVADHALKIQEAQPSLPDGLHDRAQDNWEPLLAIADLAGGVWPKLAREAALALSGGADAADDTLGVQLLSDIRAVFKDKGVDRLFSEDLTSGLISLDDRPWADYSRGKPLTKVKLARLLRPFGVVSGTKRLPAGTAKGYLLDQFADAFSRYLPPDTPSSLQDPPFKTSQRHNEGGARVSEDFENVTASACDVSENGLKASCSAGCDVVTDSTPPPEGGEGVPRETGTI